MNESCTEFLSPTGPTASATPSASRLFNIAVAATSTATDLSGAAYAGLLTAINGERVITLTASVDIWYRWDSATGTVDETKTAASTPANQGALLPAGMQISRRAPPGLGATPFLIAKGVPNAGTLCVEISSISANGYTSGSYV
jgi:hypothetical protein